MQELFYSSLAAQLIALCVYAMLATPSDKEMRDWINHIFY